jgi:hypothetical protein
VVEIGASRVVIRRAISISIKGAIPFAAPGEETTQLSGRDD